VLLLADAVRFAAIGSIPVAAITGHLTLAQLFAVGLVVGTASVFFNSAYQAYLPSIVTPDGITSANARLSVSETSAQVAGPTLAGLLINFFGAAGALLLDAGSFVASIVSLLLIRKREPRPRRERRSLVPDVREGLRVVFGNPLLRGLTLTSTLSNLGRGMALELFLLFAYTGLQMSPALAGAVLAAGNVGSLLGALTCNRVTARVGIGPMLLIGSIMKGLPWVFIPLALLGGAVPISIAVMILSGYFIPISNVTTLSIRQSLVSRQLQGRVAATTRTVTRTVLPLSAVLGGGLAQIGTGLLGPRAGLAWVLAFGGLLWTSATFLIPRRALRHVRSISDLKPDAAGRAKPGADAAAPAEAAPRTGPADDPWITPPMEPSVEPWAIPSVGLLAIPSAARWTADPGLYDASPAPAYPRPVDDPALSTVR
jgi:predicted MFS family arabinose efflux permease